MTDLNIKDTAKKIFKKDIVNSLSVKLNSQDEFLLKTIIEEAIRFGYNAK